MPPKSRPIDAQLDAWILSLFPVDSLPIASGDAEQYIDQVDGEIIDKYAPTVSGWQYIAKRLCTLEHSALTGECSSALMFLCLKI